MAVKDMPLVRVTRPVHTWLMEMARIQSDTLGRTVGVSQVIEMLKANYEKSVERESEDDNDYGSR